MLAAIIVAAGTSQRMGFDKTLALLSGRPVICHAIAAFEEAPSVNEIVVVGRENVLAELENTCAPRAFGKLRGFVAGGARRQDSVTAGLKAASPELRYVAVHDAARCLVTPAQIEHVFTSARATGAAALAAPVTDTLKRATADLVVSGSVEREGLYSMQTPQIFLRELLMEAYGRVARKKVDITDEVSAVQHLGRKVVIVPNRELNLKITFPADLALAEGVLAARRSVDQDNS